MSGPQIPDDRRTVAQLGVAVAMFAMCVGAFLALALTGHDTDGLIRAVVLFAGLFGLGSFAAAGFRQSHQKLDKIAHQTNGQLDERMRKSATDAALAALELHEQRRTAAAGPVDPLEPADLPETPQAPPARPKMIDVYPHRRGGPRGAAGA